MEYVAGIDLHRLVEQRGPLPVAWACDYVRQAALGLQHAQSAGPGPPRHQAEQPDRLAGPRRRTSRPRRRSRSSTWGWPGSRPSTTPEQSPITQVGAFMGTPDFIAPEQANDPRQADTRSDLYSLGCTFYFLLTGQPPFTGATPMAKVMQHHVQDADPRRAGPPGGPARVGAVVRRLLAKRPEDRYQTPADLCRALRRWPDRPRAGSPPPATPRRPRPPRAPRPAWPAA